MNDGFRPSAQHAAQQQVVKAHLPGLDTAPTLGLQCGMRRFKLLFLLPLLILPFLFILSADAETLTGKCIAVSDGDTATIQTKEGERIIVRFQGIDAPENGQEYGPESREKLTGLILGKKVKVAVIGKDHYKRTLGHVYLGKRRICTEMVAGGYAWHYERYAPDDGELAKAQRQARAARNGLWKHKSPLPPWEWRKAKREASGGKAERRSTPADGKYWVSKAGKIHNKSCEAYGISQSGTYTNNPQGVNCKACGGTGR